MGKYDGLSEALRAAPGRSELSFEAIDALVGGLPPAAFRQRAWWANSANRHIQARAWLNLGRRVVAVDLSAGRITFSEPSVTHAGGDIAARPRRVGP